MTSYGYIFSKKIMTFYSVSKSTIQNEKVARKSKIYAGAFILKKIRKGYFSRGNFGLNLIFSKTYEIMHEIINETSAHTMNRKLNNVFNVHNWIGLEGNMKFFIMKTIKYTELFTVNYVNIYVDQNIGSNNVQLVKNTICLNAGYKTKISLVYKIVLLNINCFWKYEGTAQKKCQKMNNSIAISGGQFIKKRSHFFSGTWKNVIVMFSFCKRPDLDVCGISMGKKEKKDSGRLSRNGRGLWRWSSFRIRKVLRKYLTPSLFCKRFSLCMLSAIFIEQIVEKA